MKEYGTKILDTLKKGDFREAIETYSQFRTDYLKLVETNPDKARGFNVEELYDNSVTTIVNQAFKNKTVEVMDCVEEIADIHKSITSDPAYLFLTFKPKS